MSVGDVPQVLPHTADIDKRESLSLTIVYISRDAAGPHTMNKSKLSRELGISRFALQRKLDKYGVGVGTGDDED